MPKTPRVCGGDACIPGARIMVWLFVQPRFQRRESQVAGNLGLPPLKTGLDEQPDHDPGAGNAGIPAANSWSLGHEGLDPSEMGVEELASSGTSAFQNIAPGSRHD